MLLRLLIQNIVPEAIAIITISLLDGKLPHSCWQLLIYSVAIRLIWQSAIIVHGLGHTIAIALADRELLAINFTNILEHQSITVILKSLLPCHRIFIPVLAPHLIENGAAKSLYLKLGKPHYIKTKALGGIALNLLFAVWFSHSHSWFSQALVAANLLIALASLSDL